MFVAKCSDEYKKFFLDPQVTWEALNGLMKKAIAMGSDEARAKEGRNWGRGPGHGSGERKHQTTASIGTDVRSASETAISLDFESIKLIHVALLSLHVF